MTTATVNIGTLITQTPGLHGEAPHIAGKGVTVRRIVLLMKQGFNPEKIAEEISYLSLAEIYAALSYYYANSGEIDENIALEARVAKELERQYGQPRLT